MLQKNLQRKESKIKELKEKIKACEQNE